MNKFKSFLPRGMNRIRRRTFHIACATTLAWSFMVSLPQLAFADHVKAPRVPANIQVPAGTSCSLMVTVPVLRTTSAYPSGTGARFRLFTPQATLFNDDDKEVTTHYFSPNPFEGGTIRAAWQYSRDASVVWGRVGPGESSSDPNFVAPDAIPWLLVRVVGAKDVLTRGETLRATTFIQRLNTSGALATGFTSPADVGNQAFVPYWPTTFSTRRSTWTPGQRVELRSR